MRAADEVALFCDLWQYYGLHGFGTIPVIEEAMLATHLQADSRVMKSISGIRFSFDQLLLASILDQERISNWRGTKDAQHKRNFPKSITEELLNGEKKKEKDKIETFDNGAGFEAQRNAILKRIEANG